MAAISPSGSSGGQHPRRLDGVLHGVFALAGVVIGALVTAGVTYLGDRDTRIADQRAAQRLVSAEIRTDTLKLFYVHEFGREGKSGSPTSVEWISQAPTLARDSPLAVWTAVSAFYYEVATIQPSLAATCVGSDTWAYAQEYAESGNAALRALGEPPVPLPGNAPQATTLRVRSCH